MPKPDPSNRHKLHDAYLQPGSRLAPYANALLWFARNMLDRAVIAQQFDAAQTLLRLERERFKQKSEHEDLYQISVLLSRCFEPIADDLMLLSAFELFAKSKLLRRQYVVHQIDAPESVKKSQTKRPVHVQTLRAMERQGDLVTFSGYTLGLGLLLKPSYRRSYPLPPKALVGLEEIRTRRNLVHFNMGFAWQITDELLAAVDYLNAQIPVHDPVRRRRNRKR